MLFGFVLLFGYAFIVWLVFFRFKWLKFNITWGIVSVSVGLHLLIIFMVGLRFMTPYATEAKMIQHTIQLTPRLSEPTLVEAVLVEQNVPVKKGTPLFQFDRRPYAYKVKQLEANLAKAKQDVLVMKADIQVNAQKVVKLKAELEYAKYQTKLSTDLAKQGAGPEEDAQKWVAQVAAYTASIKEAQAEAVRIAQQAVLVVGAKLLPQVGATAGGRITHDRDQEGSSTSDIVYAGVAWEADVWGRLRAQRAAAEATAAATALDYQFARQSLAATVAKAWYLTYEARQLLALAEQSVKVYGELLALVKIRRAAGKDTDLNIADTSAKLDIARAQVQSSSAAYGEARRALEVLLGRYPATEIEAVGPRWSRVET